VSNLESLTVDKVEESLDAISEATLQLSTTLKREKERKEVALSIFSIVSYL